MRWLREKFTWRRMLTWQPASRREYFVEHADVASDFAKNSFCGVRGCGTSFPREFIAECAVVALAFEVNLFLSEYADVAAIPTERLFSEHTDMASVVARISLMTSPSRAPGFTKTVIFSEKLLLLFFLYTN